MAEVSLLPPWLALGLRAISFGDVHEDDRQACKDLILLADALGGSPQRPIFLQVETAGVGTEGAGTAGATDVDEEACSVAGVGG